MLLKVFINNINQTPDQVTFEDTISTVDENYDFTPVEFSNGELINSAGQNSGSCKVFALAKILDLSPIQTLNCFGDYYRKDVLENPEMENHQNIRNFMKTGWDGIKFMSDPLIEK